MLMYLVPCTSIILHISHLFQMACCVLLFVSFLLLRGERCSMRCLAPSSVKWQMPFSLATRPYKAKKRQNTRKVKCQSYLE